LEVTETLRLLRIHRVARISLAWVWIYHGLVPKLLYRDWTEIRLLGDAGVDLQLIPSILQVFGLAEIGFGLLILANWRSRWPLLATIGIMVGSLLAVAQRSPTLLTGAFNPVTLNTLMIALALIALWTLPGKPASKT